MQCYCIFSFVINSFSFWLLASKVLLEANLLKPVSGYIHDWMHTMASQGVMQSSIWLLLSTTNVWSQMESFLQLWTLPSAFAKAGKLHDLFTAKRTKFYKEHQRFKSTASETLGLTTLLQYMVQVLLLPAEIQVDQCHSFLEMAAVLEMLQATAQGKVQPASLQCPSCIFAHVHGCFPFFLMLAVFYEAYKATGLAAACACRCQVEKALAMFKQAGNENQMLRKHHWMLHLSTHLKSWGFLPNCWPLERKHKILTMYATNMKKITCYSQSLIEEVLCHDIHSLRTSEHFEPGVHLLKKHACSKQLHQLLCSSVFQTQIPKEQICAATAAMLDKGGQVHQKDYVLIQDASQLGWQIAKVEAHFEAQGLVCSLVTMCQILEYNATTYSAVVQQPEALHFVPTARILCPVIWATEQQKVRVLIPWSFRPR